MGWISSGHWVCLFLKDEFPTPCPFGENLSNPLCSQGFLFSVLFVCHFSRGGSEVVRKIYLLPISARAAEVFPSARSPWRSPLLLSSCQPCINWTIYWGLRSIIEGPFDGSISPIFLITLLFDCKHRTKKSSTWLLSYWYNDGEGLYGWLTLSFNRFMVHSYFIILFEEERIKLR